MSKIDIDRAAKLWAEKKTASAIADELGTNERYIFHLAERHRDRFPIRHIMVSKRNPVPRPAPKVISKVSAAHVVRTTITGAKITLTRIPTIDGPAEDGAKTMFTDLSDTGQRGLF